MLYLIADVLQQFEMVSIHAEVLEDLGVVHVVWVISRDWEVAVAHHFLGDVDGE